MSERSTRSGDLSLYDGHERGRSVVINDQALKASIEKNKSQNTGKPVEQLNFNYIVGSQQGIISSILFLVTFSLLFDRMLARDEKWLL